MNVKDKVGLIAIPLGILFAYLIIKFVQSEKKDEEMDLKEEDIEIAIEAMNQAVISNEEADTLKELAAEVKKQYGVRVAFDKTTNIISAYDSSGKLLRRKELEYESENY